MNVVNIGGVNGSGKKKKDEKKKSSSSSATTSGAKAKTSSSKSSSSTTKTGGGTATANTGAGRRTKTGGGSASAYTGAGRRTNTASQKTAGSGNTSKSTSSTTSAKSNNNFFSPGARGGGVKQNLSKYKNSKIYSKWEDMSDSDKEFAFRNSNSSANKWAEEASSVLSNAESHYSTYRKDTGKKSLDYQAKINRLISGGQYWKEQYKGNSDAVHKINSIMQALESGDSYVRDMSRYYFQFDNENSYKESQELNKLYNMSSSELEGHLKDKNPIAYTTLSGQNITWKNLYDSRTKEENFNVLYNNLSSMSDWEKMSQYRSTQGSGMIPFLPADAEHEWINDPVTKVSERTSDLSVYKYVANQMTDEERAVFNYLYNKSGKDRAYAFMDSIQSELKKRQENANIQSAIRLAKEVPVLPSVASFVTNLLSPIEYAYDALDYYVFGELTGRDTMDTNHAAALTSAIRGTVSENTDWMIGDWDAHDFLYSTAMSGVDSLLASGIYGIGGGISLGLSAAAQATNDALSKGQTNKQAFLSGLVSGVFESLWESVSIGKFKALKDVTPKSIKDVVKNIGKQMLVNASEEFNTEVANIVYDSLANGAFSDYESSVRAYMQIGMSESEARTKAASDLAFQTIEAAASGALMGAGFGGIGSIQGYINGGKVASDIYGSDPAALINESLEIDPNNTLALKLKEKLDKGKNISGMELNQLVQKNERTMNRQDTAAIQKAVSDRLTELGETGDIEALSIALTKRFSGKKLSNSENALIQNSQYGTRVSYEMNPTNIQSGDYASEWAENIGTNRINPEEYSRIVKASQITQDTQGAEDSSVTADTDFDAPARAQDTETASAENQDSVQPEIDEHAAPDVQEAAVPAAQTLEEASEKYGEQADAMLQTYSEGQDVDEYDAAYKIAYDMGESGIPFDYVNRYAGTSYLTADQRKAAYEAGVSSAATSAGARDSEIKQGANGKTGWKQGVVSGEGVTGDDLQKAFNMNSTQVRAYNILTDIAKATGLNIVLYKSSADKNGKLVGAQGKYNHSEPGTLYIDLNAGLSKIQGADDLGKYTMLRTFSHEFTHFIENWNPSQYNVLRKAVFEAIDERSAEDGLSAHELVMKKMDNGLSYEAASREVTAEALTDILPDANFVETLAQKHKSVFEMLRDKLKEFATKIREYFENIGDNPSREARALKQSGHYVDSIVKLFDNVAVQAVENYQSNYAVDETSSAENSAESKAAEKTPSEPKAKVQAEPYVSENGYTITDNAEYGSIEVKFDSKPEQAVLDALKSNKFRWHKQKKVWYGKSSRETVISALDEAYAASGEAESIQEAAAEPTFTEIFENATQKEKDEVVDAIDENMGKLSHVFPTEIREEVPADTEAKHVETTLDNAHEAVHPAEENQEVVSNGKESENGSDTGAIQQPVSRSEGASRLLEGVEPEAVRTGSEGRGPVRDGIDAGTEDAGRDGRTDSAGTVSERSTRDRVAGDLQWAESVDGGEGPGTGLSGAVQEERSDHDGRGAGRLGGELPGLRAEQLHEEVQQEIQKKSTTQPKGGNFVIGDSLNLPSGTKARVRANIDAIRLVKQIASEGRIATPAEQEILSKYVGWGGLADAFGKPVSNKTTRKLEYKAASGLEKEFADLKEVLTEEEYKAARESTKNSHYTSIEVIRAMYSGLKQMGFTGGRMLEPSSGIGNFVGAMPADMASTVKSWTMVELDNITGMIAKYLYPNADVRIQGFEEINIPDNYMDVAIGNVPFGNYAIPDKKYPKAVTAAIHNYFFAKALDKVRPGGIVMFITSSYTMNSRDSAVRKYMMQRADLLGAIRLPNTAFAGNAGTSVVTDILVLKKRADRTAYSGEAFEEANWERISQTGWDGAYVNEYFTNHPEMVLGTPKVARGMYSGNELTYDPFTDRGTLGEQITEAWKNITGKMDYAQQFTPEKANFKQAAAKKKAQKLKVKDGVIQAQDENGNITKVDVDADTASRITGMVAVRDAYTELCDALQQGVTKQETKRLRNALNKAYDSFVKQYGYLNAPKNKKAIKAFADSYQIQSLENYSEVKETVNGKVKKTIRVTKADIFSKDTIAANRTSSRAENVEEGLTISLNTSGTVDVPMIARLTGQEENSVKRQLIDQRLVFKDKDGVLIPAVQYLSGNVRAKLREMEGLVSLDSDYINNVEALRNVVPPTVPYTDIYVNPGANWIPVSVYEGFVGHILDRSNYTNYKGVKNFSVEYVSETNEYKVTLNDGYAKSSVQNTQVWAEGGKSFSTIFENMLNGRRTNVYTEGVDGKRVLDKVKTEAVAEKVEKLNEEFRKWLWSDETRRNEMQELYNEAYNALVTPKYRGSTLTVNGLNSTYSLRDHQKDAVSRIINSGGNTLLAHRVGAGKTMEMAAAAMKLKQLGVVKKPMFVVPNNVVAQWGAEFKDYFPAANILLVGDEDMTPAERMTTINKIKNNDYDAVILAYTKFEKIQMTKEWRKKFYEEQIDSLLFAINAEKENQKGKGFTVKQLEAKRKQLENKIKKLTEKEKDEDGAMFEDLGVDSLFVDEAHNFKNLEYSTRMNNVSGLGKPDGSQRAFDLYTKVRYLQQLNGGRGIVFATATPVMNSMTEMYIMQKYLQPDTLKQLGIDNFDSWAKMFGEVVNALEIKPSGSGYRIKQTFSKFKNIKALQQLFRSFTDVVTDIPGLKIPKMKGGKVQIVECEQSEFQKNYMAELAQRAENVNNVDPSEDNMLKITSDGRKISYSQRMIDPTLPYEEAGKIYKCCENVYNVYKESSKTKGTQMIFCDIATPKGKADAKKGDDTDTGEFSTEDAESAQLYDDMKARLVQLGIPENEIAFIHDAKNNKQKKELSEKMNAGVIRVLIGSTGKMGVGLNAQVKAVAIHHLDAPWRPGDIEQRDGRVFRQKNENEEAYKFVYVTKGSFDSRLWDILERKQKFINQIMNGDDVGNEVEDTGEVTLSAAEVKAVASDNPLIMEQVALEKEISKLESLQQAYRAGVERAKEMISSDERKIAILEKRLSDVADDLKARKDTYSDDKVFSIKIGKNTYTNKKDAGTVLAATAQAKAVEGEYTTIGSFAGFDLRVVKTREGISGLLSSVGTYEFRTYPLNTTYGINHLISVVESLDEKQTGWQKALKETRADLVTQRTLAEAPFEQADKIREKRSRYNEVMYALNPPQEQTLNDDTVQEQSRDYLDDDTEQYQQRTDTLTDREVLALASSQLANEDLTSEERSVLGIFDTRIHELYELQEKRREQGRIYKEQQFGTNVDREEAEKTRNRMKVLDGQIERASSRVLEVENKAVLKRILQRARKIVEQNQREHDQAIIKRRIDRMNNAAAIRKYRTRIQTDTNELTKWVLHPNNKSIVKHIPDAIKDTVIPFLESIDFTSKQQLNGGKATKADKEFEKQLKALKNVLNENINVEGLYSGYNDLPPNFMDNLQTFMDAVHSVVEKNTGTFVINEMSSEELHELSKIVRTLKKYIMDMNTFHNNAMFQHTYEAGDNSIEYMNGLKSAGNTGAVSNFLFWQQMRPAYAFERFGKGGIAIYDELRRGQDALAFNTKKIIDFSQNTYTEKEVKAWEKETHTVELGDDLVKIPVSGIMSLYELSKRPQGLQHILGGGIRVATYKDGKNKISDTGHTVTLEEVNRITETLTPRQKEVADALQKFMAEQGGEWGNYVSVKRFGESLFGEKNYFPINSDGRHLQAEADEKPGAASLYALLNMGFTKELNEKANNRVVLYSIFDVFANHMASMAQYNALALPVLDALKWFNYKQSDAITGQPSTSVRDEMNRVFGTPEETRPGAGKKGYAENFVINILKAYNGTEAQGAPMDSIGLKMLHKYNRAQVAFNFRVVVQQPLAITRAGMLIDYRSILRGMKLSPSAIRKNISEMQQYSGIAAWKSLGFYDVNISRGLTSLIKHDESKMDKFIEIGMAGAEKADTLTWAAMWSACKEEVMRKQKLKPGDNGFFEAVTELFENVIYKTQVVDSVLTKNEFIRDKGLFARTVGSFMSEPTTTASMLLDTVDKMNMDRKSGLSFQQTWKKNGKAFVRTVYVYAIGAVLLASVQAAADALRDDDDYEDFLEKWLEAFKGDLIDEANPFNKLPILSDLSDLVKEILAQWTDLDVYGNAPNSVIMQWYDSLVKGSEIMHDLIVGNDTNYTWYAGGYKLLQALSGMTGVPLAAITREIASIWNTFVGAMAPSLKLKIYDGGEMNELKYAYKDGYLTDEEATALLLEKGLVDTEDEAYWKIQEWADSGDGFSKYDDVYDAVRNGGDFDAAMDELTSHGVSEKDALSEVKGKIGEWYKGGEVSKQQATEMLKKYTKLTDKEIASAMNKWSCVVVTGIPFDDIKDEYLAGNISASRAAEMYSRYGGYELGAARETVSKWNFESKYGYTYSEIGQRFRDGELSAREMLNVMTTYGGKTMEEAQSSLLNYVRDGYDDGIFSENAAINMMVQYCGVDQDKALNKVRYINIRNQFPNIEIDDHWVSEYYDEIEPYGISPEIFFNYRDTVKGITGEGKKQNRMAVIDSLPISSSQKDALYYAEGWAASRIYEAPWH